MDDAFQARVDSLKQDYFECEQADTKKKVLIEELLKTIDEAGDELAASKTELQEKKDLVRFYREESKRLRELDEGMAGNSYVLVLIDGDSMPFKDELVKQGKWGGSEAARLLLCGVEQYLKSTRPDLDTKIQIITRVYANLKGLIQVYQTTEISAGPDAFGEFIRGFNMADAMCEIVDAGTGKECADEKVKGNFNLQFANYHCKHILFGASADNGYARLLGPYTKRGDELRKRLTMIEGPSFARELIDFIGRNNILTTSFDSCFRKSKIDFFRAGPPPPVTTTKAPLTPLLSGPVAKSPRTFTGFAGQPKAERKILRNSKGQRVYEQVSFSPTELMEVNELNLCNHYYLLKHCWYGSTCRYGHEDDIHDTQLAALAFLARCNPCAAGLTCQNVNCIAGHQCNNNPRARGKTVLFLQKCTMLIPQL